MSDKQAFVANIEKKHGRRLRRFLAARIGIDAADVQDLAQEVFLRLLRIDRHDTIRSSEAYLFTIAHHVLHQEFMRRSAMPEAIEITALADEMESPPPTDPARRVEMQQEFEQLKRAVQQLSPKALAVLILHRRDGYSLEEVGARLGFSRSMAAKYLAKALSQCRQHFEQKGEGAR